MKEIDLLEDPEIKKAVDEHNAEGLQRAIGLLAGILLIILFSCFIPK